MREYIKKIQSKSEETRKLIFAGSLIFLMSIIGFIWIYSLSVKFGSPKIAEQANEDIKPFKLFSNTMSDTYKNLSASVGKTTAIKDEIKNDTIETKQEKQIDLIPVEYTN